MSSVLRQNVIYWVYWDTLVLHINVVTSHIPRSQSTVSLTLPGLFLTTPSTPVSTSPSLLIPLNLDFWITLIHSTPQHTLNPPRRLNLQWPRDLHWVKWCSYVRMSCFLASCTCISLMSLIVNSNLVWKFLLLLLYHSALPDSKKTFFEGFSLTDSNFKNCFNTSWNLEKLFNCLYNQAIPFFFTIPWGPTR